MTTAEFWNSTDLIFLPQDTDYCYGFWNAETRFVSITSIICSFLVSL